MPLTGVINYVFFCIYICCFIANFDYRKMLVNSRTITEPKLSYFYFCLPGRWDLAY